MTSPNYTGTLSRGETPDTVVGSLVDSFGWVIRITGRRTPDGKGYILEGALGETPDALRIEGLDDDLPVNRK